MTFRITPQLPSWHHLPARCRLGAMLAAATVSLGASHAGAQIFPRGTTDNFALPTEPATPSIGQRNYVGPGRWRNYDQEGNDLWHIEHFGNLPCGITAANLVFVLKPATSSLSYNDSFGIDFISPTNTIAWPNANRGPEYYIRIGADTGVHSIISNQWIQANYPLGRSFNLDLANLPTPATGETNLIARLNQYGYLNFAVQDDTYIDHINLVVTAGGTPLNDACANATPLTPGLFRGSTSCATPDGIATCGSSNTTNSVWYRYDAMCTGMAAVDTCGSSYDTVLSVYSGVCSALTQIGCNDDASGGSCPGSINSYISFPVVSGQTYYVRVSGFSGGAGAYALTLTTPGSPVNDACDRSMLPPLPAIVNGTYNFDTRCATTDGSPTSDCSVRQDNQIWNDLWYNYTASCTGTLLVSTCGTVDFDTRIAIYDAADPCNSVSPRACSDDATVCSGGSTQVFLPVQVGEHLRIRLGGYKDMNTVGAGLTGEGMFTVSCETTCPPTSPDTFVTRTYGITGTASGVPHAWCITVFHNGVEQCRFCDYSITPILSQGATDVEMVTAFANAINAYGFTTQQIEARQGMVFDQVSQMDVLTSAFKIKMANPDGTWDFTLGLGADGSEPGVNSSGLACDPVTFETCYFNPGVRQIATSGLDCNNNGEDDAIDIFLGISQDLNGDGIPDECVTCPCDWNNSGTLTSQDFFDFIVSFFDGNADFNTDGQTTSQDFFDFITCFFSPPIGCP